MKKQTKTKSVRQQPRKDSRSKRINCDNERVDKFDREFSKDPDTTKIKKSNNDISWYSRNPELMRASGSLPFSSILGDKLYFGGGNPTIPGILQFSWAPEIGGGVNAPTAINQCAASMYSYLVHANSRNYKYDQSDLMILVLAGGSVFAALANVIRAYGVAKTYWEQNRYTPRALLHAMGFDAQDFIENLGQVWFDINNLIAQTSQIWIPNTLPLIQRWFWLSSNVFMDANDPKGQLYVFTPQCVLKYEPLLTDKGGGVIASNIPNSDNWFTPSHQQNSWNVWKTTIQAMIDALIKDQDRGIIFGDILNAYGNDKIYAIPPLDSNYRVEPVFNAEVLTQIENLTVSPNQWMTGICQENDTLVPMRLAAGANEGWDYNGALPNSPILNFHQASQPTPEQVMIATRLQACTTERGPAITLSYKDGYPVVNNKNKTAFYPIHAGSEVITHVRMYADADWESPNVLESFMTNYNETQPSLNEVTFIKKLMAFDWHPFFYNLQPAEDQETQGCEVIEAFGDYANYLVMSPVVLNKLHSTALFSEFGVPQI